VAGQKAAQGVPKVLRFDGGQVAQVTEVDTQDRDAIWTDQVYGPEHRPVSAQAYGQVQGSGSLAVARCPARRRGIQELGPVALVSQPLGGFVRQADGALPQAVGYEANGGHVQPSRSATPPHAALASLTAAPVAAAMLVAPPSGWPGRPWARNSTF